MLRPATYEERDRRKEIHSEAGAAAYANRKFLFLSGPCPRGRYQSYATLQFLRSLSTSARAQISCLSLLVQPYEEDCSESCSKRAYAELADYIVQHLPAFNTLYLHIWDDEMKFRDAASVFSILLNKSHVKIEVGVNWWRGEMKQFHSARAFLEAMTTPQPARGGRRIRHGKIEEGLMWQETREKESNDDVDDGTDKKEEGDTGESPTGEDGEGSEHSDGVVNIAPEEAIDPDSASAVGKTKFEDSSTQPKKGSKRKEETELCDTTQASTQEEHNSDDEWTDATLSPTSPLGVEEGSWQVL